jgi:hypothetical protein
MNRETSATLDKPLHRSLVPMLVDCSAIHSQQSGVGGGGDVHDASNPTLRAVDPRTSRCHRPPRALPATAVMMLHQQRRDLSAFGWLLFLPHQDQSACDWLLPLRLM